ncbi:uncharacterized protein B0P05DRAFT_562871 [Gilbertella persicaria]|uniref:uncharacterized protein n=1 Tax=Gilbertella persicaria TaxID=101096 RepID=UPI0022207892|nr:uncharacterized protein B0P05DRAFT_562871 [Gilbertella persicaria]KAI8051079.1 hypothetical protein B0P05DRAFT_562871 [Gilbertella persicaria]
MKSSLVLFVLGLFVASVSAACDCKPTEQACIDKCVMAANSCIVKCDKEGGSGCRDACITSNWPSSMQAPEKKDILAPNSTQPVSSASAGPTSSVSAPNSSINKPSGSPSMAKPTASNVPKTNMDVKTNGSTHPIAHYGLIAAVAVGSTVWIL